MLLKFSALSQGRRLVRQPTDLLMRLNLKMRACALRCIYSRLLRKEWNMNTRPSWAGRTLAVPRARLAAHRARSWPRVRWWCWSLTRGPLTQRTILLAWKLSLVLKISLSSKGSSIGKGFIFKSKVFLGKGNGVTELWLVKTLMR